MTRSINWSDGKKDSPENIDHSSSIRIISIQRGQRNQELGLSKDTPDGISAFDRSTLAAIQANKLERPENIKRFVENASLDQLQNQIGSELDDLSTYLNTYVKGEKLKDILCRVNQRNEILESGNLDPVRREYELARQAQDIATLAPDLEKINGSLARILDMDEEYGNRNNRESLLDKIDPELSSAHMAILKKYFDWDPEVALSNSLSAAIENVYDVTTDKGRSFFPVSIINSIGDPVTSEIIPALLEDKVDSATNADIVDVRQKLKHVLTFFQVNEEQYSPNSFTDPSSDLSKEVRNFILKAQYNGRTLMEDLELANLVNSNCSAKEIFERLLKIAEKEREIVEVIAATTTVGETLGLSEEEDKKQQSDSAN
jgi:hypothetical protein